MLPLRRFFFSLFAALTIASLAGCQSTTPSPSPETNSPRIPAKAETKLTFLEAKLLELIEEEETLNALAAEPDADPATVQRLFQQLARNYSSLLANNPDSLEARLLFAKLLANFGDSEGARSQLLMAANIDSNIAVIHQQLGNYYAEEGDPTRALAYYLNAIRLEPDVPQYHFGLGELITFFEDELIAETGFDTEKLQKQMLDAFQSAALLAPDNLQYQFRYGEAFMDQSNPDWQIALLHWETLQTNPQLSIIQADAVRLHRAKALVELDRVDEAWEIAKLVTTKGLFPTRDALFEKGIRLLK